MEGVEPMQLELLVDLYCTVSTFGRRTRNTRAFDNWRVRWVVYAMGAALINIFIFLQHSAWKDYASYLEEGESPHDDWEHLGLL